jgi:hypothetical protein
MESRGAMAYFKLKQFLRQKKQSLNFAPYYCDVCDRVCVSPPHVSVRSLACCSCDVNARSTTRKRGDPDAASVHPVIVSLVIPACLVCIRLQAAIRRCYHTLSSSLSFTGRVAEWPLFVTIADDPRGSAQTSDYYDACVRECSLYGTASHMTNPVLHF